MIKHNELTIKEWFTVIKENLPFESEEQTLSVIFETILYTWKHGLISLEQISAIFEIVSRMELTIVDESKVTKAALIQGFCSAVVASGIIIEPKDMTPE